VIAAAEQREPNARAAVATAAAKLAAAVVMFDRSLRRIRRALASMGKGRAMADSEPPTLRSGRPRRKRRRRGHAPAAAPPTPPVIEATATIRIVFTLRVRRAG
jgi:hypothetical protein